MLSRKGRKKTPEGLDFAFARKLIAEEDYKEFWPRWWDATKGEQEDIIEELLGKAVDVAPQLPLKGSLTKDKKEAEWQAESIGGYVVRRNKYGQFSKRGSIYQAIRRGKKL